MGKREVEQGANVAGRKFTMTLNMPQKPTFSSLCFVGLFSPYRAHGSSIVRGCCPFN